MPIINLWPFLSKPCANSLSPVHNLAFNSKARATNGVSSSSISAVKLNALFHESLLIKSSEIKLIDDKTKRF